MKQEVCILPVRCVKCGGVFDLWYDLHEQEKQGMGGLSMQPEMGQLIKESHCWKCRQMAIDELKEVNSTYIATSSKVTICHLT